MGMKKMNPEDVRHIVVHCSATKGDQDIGVKDIDRWHRAQGWAKVGYHFVIRRNGIDEAGRFLHEPGAHAQGYNEKSIGICLVGGLDKDGKPDDNFTVSQMSTLIRLLDYLNSEFPQAQVLGHRDLPGVKKACPCFDVRAWLKSVKQ